VYLLGGPSSWGIDRLGYVLGGLGAAGVGELEKRVDLAVHRLLDLLVDVLVQLPHVLQRPVRLPLRIGELAFAVEAGLGRCIGTEFGVSGVRPPSAS
jgi:hypothetical protein